MAVKKTGKKNVKKIEKKAIIVKKVLDTKKVEQKLIVQAKEEPKPVRQGSIYYDKPFYV